MSKKSLYHCNILLAIVAPLAVSSGILLEFLHGGAFSGISFNTWVYAHVLVSLMCMILISIHLRLHWGKLSEWNKKLHSLRSRNTKWLTVFALLVVVSGIIATLHWLSDGHSGIGGLHGKIGWILAIFMIIHLFKKGKWYIRILK